MMRRIDAFSEPSTKKIPKTCRMSPVNTKTVVDYKVLVNRGDHEAVKSVEECCETCYTQYKLMVCELG